MRSCLHHQRYALPNSCSLDLVHCIMFLYVYFPQVEKQIGERRKISFHGIGLSVAPEINFDDIASGCENPEEVDLVLQAKKAFSLALYGSVIEQYNVLESAIYGYQGLNASNSLISLSQPWS
ncbi:hypothetical protein BHE74_00018972 [Ensete ventricosum]|nr:hypothetical protein GW17_00002883 [Ensete ventricosum]RWW73170.1 hypothetical protein BHE74_00018972 [Ensete ventricosum]RZR98230.1 hypothetical protein BHM03_00027544 [Ensete ventricosum]